MRRDHQLHLAAGAVVAAVAILWAHYVGWPWGPVAFAAALVLWGVEGAV